MYDFDEIIDRKNTNSVKWAATGSRYNNPNILPMWVADMDFATPKQIVEDLKKTAENSIFGYPLPPNENKELINAVKIWLKRRNEWKINSEEIGFSNGVIPALSLALKSVTELGDSVILQTPFYGHFKTLIEDSHRTLINNPVIEDQYGYQLDFEDFEQKIIDNNVKAFILCNPHNPTGRVWSENELLQLAKICKKHNVWILSDDIHSDLVLPGYNYQPLAKICPEYKDHIVTFKSVSKTFNLAGLQSAYYITTNNELLKKMDMNRNESFQPKMLNTFATAAMISAYHFGERWLEEVLKYIETNYNYLDSFIQKNLPKARVANLEATYLSWIDVSYLGITEEELKQKLDNAGLGVETSSEFGITSPKRLYIRINIATQMSNLQIGLQRLVEALN
ncbi:MalY/PatB family protein [Companilactobacillus sp. DQM5]|uniref:MalY/PatB family protein n=1 Tax=Companilactobacillus sp. DQM5 TaxID=3463359 RepID=UPI0040581E2D